MRVNEKYNLLLKIVIVMEDLLLLNVAYLLLLFIFPSITLEHRSYQLLWLFINFSLFLSLTFIKVSSNWEITNIIKRVLYRTCFMLFATIALLFTLKISDLISRLFLISYFPLFFILSIIFHWITRGLMKYLLKSDRNRDKAVILGAGVLGQKLYYEFAEATYLGIHFLGFFDDDPAANKGQLLGRITDVKEYVVQNKVSNIYCTLPLSAKEQIKDLLLFAEQNVINFYVIPTTQHYMETPIILDTIGNMPVLSVRKIPLSFLHNAILKRTFDLLVSFLFLITVFPFAYLIIAIAIKISSKGPVFFTQMRTGKKGKDFKCYKFRTMRVNEESDTKQATANDTRKTRVGNFLRRTNLDELPQFINVLKGDMSIVGPRPHMLFHTDHYSAIIRQYMVRHFIKPGITGLAQITGYRGETKNTKQMEKRIKKDIYYIENWSFLLDIEIILRTFWTIFKRDKNAY